MKSELEPPSRRSYFLLSLVTAGPGLFGVLAAAGVVYSEAVIAPLFSGNYAGSYTTRVYSEPYRIAAGRVLGPEELRRRLTRLKYESVDGIPGAPGRYHEDEDRFKIFLRGFTSPLARAAPEHVELVIKEGRIRSLRRLPAAAALKAAWLEPERIYEMSGDKIVRRERLRLDEIPDYVKDAVVSAEDRRFYRHGGLDLRGVLRAALRNFHANRVSEGGSTLTQQLARTLFLSQQRTYSRKWREALIAFYMETRLTKDQIMRMYLDSVYYGQKGSASIVGLVAASQHFFNKRPKDLSLTECAFLAGVVNSPGLYNPFQNPQAATRRRNIVLAAMLKEGYITREQEEKARAAPLGVTKIGQYEPGGSDYFVAFLQRSWEKRYPRGPSLDEGLSLYTTMDPWLQEQGERAAAKLKNEAALVALDQASGAIRALVGGKDFAKSPFDRAAQASRQPGSAFKPFVYGAALENSYAPETTLYDLPKSYRTPQGLWTPKNYEGWFHGKVPLRFALAHSLNGATVRLAHDLGPDKIIEYARRLGIVSPLKPDLGLALGTYEVGLLEITGAYLPFANGGFKIEPYALEAALDANGDLLEKHVVKRESVIAPAAAETMTSLLREVVISGTAKGMDRWQLQDIAAGKTGTTDEGKDAWFIGYTPRIAAGVWTGSDMPTKLDLSGATAAVPFWSDFIRSAVHTEPLQSRVARPETGAQAPEETASPDTSEGVAPPPHKGGVVGWLRRVFGRD